MIPVPSRSATRRLAGALLALAAVSLASPRAARAQDDPEGRPATADEEDRVQKTIDSLRSPLLRRYPDKLIARLHEVFALQSPRAAEALRGYLRDTTAAPILVEQIIVLTLADPTRHDLLDDVVERLRIEVDTELDRKLDLPLLMHARMPLVERLTEFARDTERPIEFRAEAARALGRTGHAAALPVLAELWRDADPTLSAAAGRAFERVVPRVSDADEADAIAHEIAANQLPLSELLRRRLRATEVAPPPAAPELGGPYRELATGLLARATLEQILRLYVTESPLPDVRAAGAARLGQFPFDDEPDPAAARRRAGQACLAALRAEGSEAVERALLEALVPLAPALRENVDEQAMAALSSRVAEEGNASWPVRRLSVQLLGGLGDKRAVPLLQETFDGLRDTNWEFRQQILEALAQMPVDQTTWLAERAVAEPDVRIVRAMVVLLGKRSDPAAIPVYRSLLARPHPDEAVRLYCVGSLAKLWSTRASVESRAVLIEFGLRDEAAFVRESAAGSLGNRGPGATDVSVPALRRSLETDENAKVRLAAAKSLLLLDESNAVSLLLAGLAEQPIWEAYLKDRREGLQQRGMAPEQVVADADLLWEGGSPDHQARAVELLASIVQSQDELWEGGSGRGLIRERLVARLLEQGRPQEARDVALRLVEVEPRRTDPVFRWRLLVARALRACRTPDDVRAAWGVLAFMRASADLPAQLRPQVLLELGDTLLRLDDPAGALSALAAVDADALPADARERLRLLVLDAEHGSDEENERVLRLVADLEGPDEAAAQACRDEIIALGHRAARHIGRELENVTDPDALRRLLLAAGHLVGRTFILPAEATPEATAKLVGEARSALDAIVKGSEPKPPVFR